MKKTGKRVLALALSLAMAVSLLPMSVLASAVTTDDTSVQWHYGPDYETGYVLEHTDTVTEETTDEWYSSLQLAFNAAEDGDIIVTADHNAQPPEMTGNEYASRTTGTYTKGCEDSFSLWIYDPDTGIERSVPYYTGLGHCYELTVHKADCTTDGSLTGQCIRCGGGVPATEISGVDLGTATGHTYEHVSWAWKVNGNTASEEDFAALDPETAYNNGANNGYTVTCVENVKCSVCNGTAELATTVTGAISYTDKPTDCLTDGATYTWTAVTSDESAPDRSQKDTMSTTGACSHDYQLTVNSLTGATGITYYAIGSGNTIASLIEAGTLYDNSGETDEGVHYDYGYEGVASNFTQAGSFADALIREDLNEDGEDEYYVIYQLDVTCARCGAEHGNTTMVRLAQVLVTDEDAETPLCADRQAYLSGEDYIVEPADITLGPDGLYIEVTIPALDPSYSVTLPTDPDTGSPRDGFVGNIAADDGYGVIIEWDTSDIENPSVTISYVCQYCGEVHEDDKNAVVTYSGVQVTKDETNSVEPKCETNGTDIWTVSDIDSFNEDSDTFSVTSEAVEVPATGHTSTDTSYHQSHWVIDGELAGGTIDWQEVYNNGSDVKLALYLVCETCHNAYYSGEWVQAEQVTVVSRDHNCRSEGSGYYYAKFTQPSGSQSSAGDEDSTGYTIPAYGQHTVTMEDPYGDDDDGGFWYWDEPEYNETTGKWTANVHFKCSRCESAAWLERTVTLDAEVVKEPGCETEGTLKLTGAYEVGGEDPEVHAYAASELTFETTVSIEPTGHSYPHGEGYREEPNNIKYMGDQDDDYVSITWTDNGLGTEASFEVSFCCENCGEWTTPVTYEAKAVSGSQNKAASCGDGLQCFAVTGVPVCELDKNGEPTVEDCETVNIGIYVTVPGDGNHTYNTTNPTEGVDYFYTPAGCEHDSTMTFVCTICGYENVITPDDPMGDEYGLDHATGHNYEWYWHEADCCYPTFGIRYCTNYWDAEEEFDQDYAATVCENPIERWTSTGGVDKTNHRNLQESVIREADCTKAGFVYYWCDDCGYESYETVPLTDHTLSWISGQNYWLIDGVEYKADDVAEWPTEGLQLRAYYKCDICGEEVYIDYDAELTKNPEETCTTDGSGVWSVTFPTSIDKYGYTDPEDGDLWHTNSHDITIPATKHTVDEATVTWTVHYNANSDSYYAEVNWDCVCGDHSTQSDYHKVDLEISEVVDPTCEEDGYVVFKPAAYVEEDTTNWNGPVELTNSELVFDNKNEEFESAEKTTGLGATGHDPTYIGEGLEEGKNGGQYKYYACANGDTTFSNEAVEIAWTLDSEGVPTGASVGFICQNCGEVVATYTSEDVKDGNYPLKPTCITDGYEYWNVQVFDKEGDHVFNLYYAVTLEATGEHVYDWELIGKQGVTWDQVDPTCEEDGYVILYCQSDPDCEETVTLPVAGAEALGHDETWAYGAPSCVHGDLFIDYCARCGKVFEYDDANESGNGNPIDPNNHEELWTWEGNTEGTVIYSAEEKVIRDADCKGAGLSRFSCKACGESGYVSTPPQTGHDLSLDESSVTWYVDDTELTSTLKTGTDDEGNEYAYYELSNNGKVITLENFENVSVSYDLVCSYCGETFSGTAKASVDDWDANCGDKQHDTIIYYSASDTQTEPLLGEDEIEVNFAAQVEIDDVAVHHTDDEHAEWSEPEQDKDDGNWYIEVRVSCVDCGYTSATRTEALTIADTVDPTCENDGLITFDEVSHDITWNSTSYWMTTTVSTTPTYVIPATGHSFTYVGEGLVDPTIQGETYKYYACSDGETHFENEAVVIDWTLDDDGVPTGATIGFICQNCGEVAGTFESETVVAGAHPLANTCCFDGYDYWNIRVYDENDSHVFNIYYAVTLPATGKHIYHEEANFYLTDEDGNLDLTTKTHVTNGGTVELTESWTDLTEDDLENIKLAYHIRCAKGETGGREGYWDNGTVIVEPEVTFLEGSCDPSDCYAKYELAYSVDVNGVTYTWTATATIAGAYGHQSWSFYQWVFLDAEDSSEHHTLTQDCLQYEYDDEGNIIGCYVEYKVRVTCDACGHGALSSVKTAEVVFPDDWNSCIGGTATLLDDAGTYHEVPYDVTGMEIELSGTGHTYSTGSGLDTGGTTPKYWDEGDENVSIVWNWDGWDSSDPENSCPTAEVSFLCQDCGLWSDPVEYDTAIEDSNSYYHECCGLYAEYRIAGVEVPANVSEETGADKFSIYTNIYVEGTGEHVWDWENPIEKIDVTCTEDGTVTYPCSVCYEDSGATLTEVTQEALGHDLQFVEVVEPTCTSEGYRLWKCTRCDYEEHRNIRESDPLGHDYQRTNIVDDATCTEPGLERYECTRCGDWYYEVTEPTGHDYSESVINWYYDESNCVSASLDEVADLSDYVEYETLDDVELHIRITCCNNGCDLTSGHVEPEVTYEPYEIVDCNTTTYLFTATYTLEETGDEFTFQATATVSTPNANHVHRGPVTYYYYDADETSYSEDLTEDCLIPVMGVDEEGNETEEIVGYQVRYTVRVYCESCDAHFTYMGDALYADVVFADDYNWCEGDTFTLIDEAGTYHGVAYDVTGQAIGEVDALGHIYSIGPDEASKTETESTYKYYGDVENDYIKVIWADDYQSATVSFKCRDCGEWSDAVTYEGPQQGSKSHEATCVDGLNEWYFGSVKLPEGRIAEDSQDSSNNQLPLAIYADEVLPGDGLHDYSKSVINWWYGGNTGEYVSASLGEVADLSDYVTTVDDLDNVALHIRITCCRDDDYCGFDDGHQEPEVTYEPVDYTCNTETYLFTATYTLEDTGEEFTFQATATVSTPNAYHVYTGPVTYLYYDSDEQTYSSDLTANCLQPKNDEGTGEFIGYQVRYTIRVYCENCDAHFTYMGDALYADVEFAPGDTCTSGNFTLSGEKGTYHGIEYDVTGEEGSYGNFEHTYSIDPDHDYVSEVQQGNDTLYMFEGSFTDDCMAVEWADDLKSVTVQFICQTCGELSDPVTYTYEKGEIQLSDDPEDTWDTSCGGGQNYWYVQEVDYPDGIIESVEPNGVRDKIALCFIDTWEGDKNHSRNTADGSTIDSYTPASCTKGGYYTWTCGICGKTFKTYDGSAPTGHAFYDGDGTVIEAATCTHPGVALKTCIVCGETVSVEIPAIGHDWTVQIDWDLDGTTAVYTAVCKNDSSHVETGTPLISSVNNGDGSITYTATVIMDSGQVFTSRSNVYADSSSGGSGTTPTPSVDKTALEAAIAEAQSLDSSVYTAESWADLEAALADALDIDADANASQASVSAAANALNYAISHLEEVAEPVNKTALQAAILLAQSLNASDYTAESWAVLQSALNDALDVFANENASQSEVDVTTSWLNTAINGLVKDESCTHSGEYTWEFDWSEDYSEATLVIVCSNCGETLASVTAVVTTEIDGYTCCEHEVSYTATATYDGKEYVEVIEITSEATTDHTWRNYWDSELGTYVRKCVDCGSTFEE